MFWMLSKEEINLNKEKYKEELGYFKDLCCRFYIE